MRMASLKDLWRPSRNTLKSHIIENEENKELSLLNMSTNCLAKFFLDIGHNLTPEPPDNITGLAFI